MLSWFVSGVAFAGGMFVFTLLLGLVLMALVLLGIAVFFAGAFVLELVAATRWLWDRSPAGWLCRWADTPQRSRRVGFIALATLLALPVALGLLLR